eukprot:PITA_19052
MSFYGLRLEYDLKGSSNYIPWKDEMEAVLEDNGLTKYIDSNVPKPAATDAQNLVEWKKNVAKDHTRRSSRSYYLEPPWEGDSICNLKGLDRLVQNSSDHRKMALKDKIRKIKMEKGDTIPKYLIKFTQCRDELGSVGVTIVEDDLVILILLGLPKSWHNNHDSVNGREKLLEWERLSSDLV